MEMQAGELFANRYRLIKEVGRGSFGEVWQVRDEQLDLELALKVYIALDERGIEEFKGEYKTTYALNHPNLLKSNYFDVYENRPYLAMPYCPVSTADLVGKMDEPTAWRFVRDVSGGLAYLHSKDIIHRDIKPDNILESEEGDFVITDFGISVKMRSTLRRNSTRKMDADMGGGSYPYMGPEMFSSNPEAVKATDIWAMGVSLFELLCGELPFFGQGGGMLLRGAEIPEVHGDFSGELKGLLRDCLAKAPWERPTAEQLHSYAEAKLRGENPAMPWKNQGKGDQTGNPASKEGGDKGMGKQTVPRSGKGQTVPMAEGQGKSGGAVPEAKEGKGRKKTMWIAIALALLLVAGVAGISVQQNRQREIIRVGDVEFEMVYVEGGTFIMGATSEQGSDADADERPVHSVTLSSFHIGKYEVTQGLWREVMGSNPSSNKAGNDYPVEMVSWEDCQEFIRKLNDRTGLTFRLPTEAEWEYAARGGRKRRGYKYSGSNSIGDVAWYIDNSGYETHPVGRKSPNELGLYDMSGNVYEWCNDWYGSYYNSSQTNPIGPYSGFYRVLRGGCCSFLDEWFCRVSCRGHSYDPGGRFSNVGLRLVLEM